MFKTTRHRIEKSLLITGVLSTDDMCLPDFLGIGAQKAGSTWIYKNLRQHPELFLPEEKELHYFDKNFHKKLESYSRFFETSNQKIKGEITPAYSLLSSRRIRFIKRIMPRLKIFFVMRNPIDRIWSQTIMKLVGQQKRNFSEIDEAEFIRHFNRQKVQKRSRYSRILDNWLSVFPPNQMKVLFFENISSRPKRFLEEIFEFLDVSREVDWACFPYDEVIFRGSNHQIPEACRHYLENMFSEELLELERRFGEAVAGWRIGISTGLRD